jgi:hypothetical protein
MSHIVMFALAILASDNRGLMGGDEDESTKTAPASASAPVPSVRFAKTPLGWKYRSFDVEDATGTAGREEQATPPSSPAPSSGLRPRRVLPDAEGNYSYTTSKGVAIERRVDENGNVQIDFAGGDPKDFSSPTVYERAKARLQAASALAPVAAPVTPAAPAASLGGPAPAYAPPAPTPLPTWQPLAASPGYEAYGTVGPDGIWRYEPGSVRPMAGWAAQAQVQPAVNYAPPAVSYAPPVYSIGGGGSACGPYGCNVSGGPVGGFGSRGGLLGFGVLGRR